MASLEEALWNAKDALLRDMNSHQGNPVVDISTAQVVSTGNYDSTRLHRTVDTLRMAIGVVVKTSESRSQKLYDRRFSGLCSGLVSCASFNMFANEDDRHLKMVNWMEYTLEIFLMHSEQLQEMH